MTGVCFLCDTKLNGGCIQVCSSYTPYSNITYPEKIAEIIGDEVVVIVNPADHICSKCNELLKNLDKLENDFKLGKNEIITNVRKKYGILPPDQAVKGVEIFNGHLKPKKQLKESQRKVPSGVRVGVSPAVTTTATPVQTPSKLLETQQQQNQQKHQVQPPTQWYKCHYCDFEQKELEDVEFHMCIMNHVNKEETEDPILNQEVVNLILATQQQREPLYRCSVCAKSFHDKIEFRDHIQKDHDLTIPSTSRKVGQQKVPLYSCLVCKKSFYYRINLLEHIHKNHNPSTSN